MSKTIDMVRGATRRGCSSVLSLLLLVFADQSLAQIGTQQPLVVLLKATGQERDGLPVLELNPEADSILAKLAHGFPDEFFRIYRMEQTYLARMTGSPVEPVYLFLSDHEGGFPGEGFYLGEIDKRHAGYVDVKGDWPATGRFGALDQIVPHELAHVIFQQLIGPLTDGGGNQVHAIGVRTDRQTAFNEGFAEHLQVMALDHAEAAPETQALSQDRTRYERLKHHLTSYRRELSARIAIAPRMRMGFVAWYINGEKAMRYFAVKENAFTREPSLPGRLLSQDDPYAAYLLENTLLPEEDGPVKSIGRLIATEGVISTFFHRWATHEALQGNLRRAEFYEPFGVDLSDVTPLVNVYLKLFHVLHVVKPQDVLQLVASYCEVFPDESRHVEEIVAETFHGKPPTAPDEIWLANVEFETGTSLFDQYRGLPRMHTFDLNAASIVDLVGVWGIDVQLARAILDSAPFASIEDLRRVHGITSEHVRHFRELAQHMLELRQAGNGSSAEERLTVAKVLMPIVWRALAVILLATAAGVLLYRCVHLRSDPPSPGWVRSGFNGFSAALFGALANWLVGGWGWAAFLAVGVLFGIPAALHGLRKRQPARTVGLALLAWLVASTPASLLTVAWL